MMMKRYAVLLAACIMALGITQSFAWTEYVPVIFVGNMSQIYSNIPSFHGYSSEFLNSQEAKQACIDANNDGVKLDYCT